MTAGAPEPALTPAITTPASASPPLAVAGTLDAVHQQLYQIATKLGALDEGYRGVTSAIADNRDLVKESVGKIKDEVDSLKTLKHLIQGGIAAAVILSGVIIWLVISVGNHFIDQMAARFVLSPAPTLEPQTAPPRGAAEKGSQPSKATIP